MHECPRPQMMLLIFSRVKWKGFAERTWEPATSFEDDSILQEYNKRAGLIEADSDVDTDEEMSEVT